MSKKWTPPPPWRPPTEITTRDENEIMEKSDESEMDCDMGNETGGGNESGGEDTTTSNASSSEDEDESDGENAKMIEANPEAKMLKIQKPKKVTSKLFHGGYQYTNPRFKYKKGKKLEHKQIWRCDQRTRGWHIAKKAGENSVNCCAKIHVTVDTKGEEKRYFIDKIVGVHSHSGDLRQLPVATVRKFF